MSIIPQILTAVSLCADCFAVSLCSSVTLKRIDAKSVGRVALAFAVIQAGLLLCGWCFGSLFVGLLSRIAHVIGFLLLIYVGGSMLAEGIRGNEDVRNLDGLKNVLIGGIATSIDALAVGVAQSFSSQSKTEFAVLLASVFAVTAASVVSGICGGKAIGRRFGRAAEIAGGIVLIGIGITVLI